MRKKHIAIISAFLIALLLASPSFASTDTGEKEQSDVSEMLAAFPKAKITERVDSISFVFANAPAATKIRFTINNKTGEQIVMYRFASSSARESCGKWINDCAIVLSGKFVYADVKLPYTWYEDQLTRLLLYCGVNNKANQALQNLGYRPVGGYFSSHRGSQYEGMDYAAPGTGGQESMTGLLKQTKLLFLGKITNEKFENMSMQYTAAVKENIKNADREEIVFQAMPGSLSVGKTYLFFLTEQKDGETGMVTALLADGFNRSALEVDDRGYVLPRREYGMKKLQNTSSLIKSLKKNKYVKAMK